MTAAIKVHHKPLIRIRASRLQVSDQALAVILLIGVLMTAVALWAVVRAPGARQFNGDLPAMAREWSASQGQML
jgi:hypothetical protein